jgi:isoamylase
MITMGDEVRATRRGNNNAYCQDNEISWFDWNLLARHSDVHRFATLLIKQWMLRDLRAEGRSLNAVLRGLKHAWHGVKLNRPDWSFSSHILAFSAESANGKLLLDLILNAYWEPLEFELPPAPPQKQHSMAEMGRHFSRFATGRRRMAGGPSVAGPTYRAQARSVVMLFAEAG